MSAMEQEGGDLPPNPLDPVEKLKDPSLSNSADKSVHPQQIPSLEDSAVTKAEKYERHGAEAFEEESPSKRIKMERTHNDEGQGLTKSERQKGVAPIKSE